MKIPLRVKEYFRQSLTERDMDDNVQAGSVNTEGNNRSIKPLNGRIVQY